MQILYHVLLGGYFKKFMENRIENEFLLIQQILKLMHRFLFSLYAFPMNFCGPFVFSVAVAGVRIPVRGC